MRLMEFLAIIAGIVVSGLVFAGRRIDYFLILLYFMHVRSHSAFEALYDNADDEATFSLNNHSELGVKTYVNYLRLHEAVRETAYARFQVFYDSLMRLFLTRLLPILVLPALLFWSRWYVYLLGVLLASATIVIFKIFLTNHKVGFYQRMLIGAILANYQKEPKEES